MSRKSLHILIWTTCMQATGMWALLHISSSPAWTSETLSVPLAYVAIFPAISGGAAAIGSVFSANLISYWGTTKSLKVCLVALIIGLVAQSFGNYSMAVSWGSSDWACVRLNQSSGFSSFDQNPNETHQSRFQHQTVRRPLWSCCSNALGQQCL